MAEMKLALKRARGELLADVRNCCATRHYLRRWPDPRSLPMAYALAVNDSVRAPDGCLNGLLVFKKPQHHKQRDLFGYPELPTAWQVLDMARVWINPYWQQPGLNLFSRMVALGLKRLQADWLEHHPPVFPALPYHITLVISYCELRHHDGTAYRACSFVDGGKTSDGTKELYYRNLRQPLKSWAMPENVQQPLFEGMPLR